jgi:hypothetical protein
MESGEKVVSCCLVRWILRLGNGCVNYASGIHTIVAINKSKSIEKHGVLTAAAGGEAHNGFGDPVANLQCRDRPGDGRTFLGIQPFRPLSEYMLQLPNTVMNINLVD